MLKHIACIKWQNVENEIPKHYNRMEIILLCCVFKTMRVVMGENGTPIELIIPLARIWTCMYVCMKVYTM